MDLILASKSPRRVELLSALGYKFTALPANIDEGAVNAPTPSQLVEKLALEKARHVLALHPKSIVIGADTIVVNKNKILGKPKDETEAIEMLSQLSGNTHTVFTGISLISKEKECSRVVSTQVTFKSLSNEEIKNYVKTGEPMDKAGAYGIQNMGAFLVERINGDFYTVMGLPVCTIVNMLKDEFGIFMF